MAAACALPPDAQRSPASAGRHVLLRRVVLLLGQWADLVPAQMRVSLLRDAIVPALADQVLSTRSMICDALDRYLSRLFSHSSFCLLTRAHLSFSLSPPCQDLLVRLAAADALQLSLDTPELSGEQLGPLAAPICQQLLQLIATTSELDLNCHLLKCLRTVMERLEHHIRPAAALIAESLPALWNRGQQASDTDQQSLLRQTVIRIMSHLVLALGPESVALHPLAVPVLRYCLSSDEQDSGLKDSFLEEALDLWLQVLRHSPALTADLQEMFPFWFDLAAFNTHLIGSFMLVLRAYALFADPAFMQTHAPRIDRLLADLLADSTDKRYRTGITVMLLTVPLCSCI
jgi:hypothetical protein